MPGRRIRGYRKFTVPFEELFADIEERRFIVDIEYGNHGDLQPALLSILYDECRRALILRLFRALSYRSQEDIHPFL